MAEFLKNRWDNNSTQRDEIIEWFDFVHPIPVDRVLAALLCDVVRCAPKSFFSHVQWYKIVTYTLELCVTDPEASSKILRSMFADWFNRHPGKHLFTHDGIGEIDISNFDRLAEKAPAVF